ncbi:uncharacterized protein STEHIDRAFT_90522 [Stereum hirsutum FP-91666 SS1]|uniref:uncharacterized protein n=1 Tax=Stereum hirsutum (strain FP-91666) TaxID=721885 RepID=UPI000440A251|nr:uncharacterized protein STEHIDRAFT_90522 [Stereum hirsutum FP-91666 SS1]EIM90688.1 hypothetical protein STEHIDRAFT_90522 [Stereum hirsutum FP-91666 SS1]
MFFSKSFVALVALASSLVAPTLAHGTITAIAGANGVNSQGFGVISSTPRDGSTPKPFEQDTSIIRDNEIDSGKADVCGRTKAGGNNDVATQLAAAATSGLPTPAANGSVSMTLHQVNGDGAGPYTCECSADGTGADFVNMEVTTNVPGTKSRSKAKATDFALVAQMPAGVNCTGGPNGDACLVRCRNDANAGPFGSCVAVGNTDSGNSTASSTTSTGTTDSNSTTAAGTTDTGAAGTNSTATATETAATDSSAASSASTSTSTGTTESSTGGNTTDSSIADPASSSNLASSSATASIDAATVGSKTAKGKATVRAPVKRYIRSRVAGKRTGQWIDI